MTFDQLSFDITQTSDICSILENQQRYLHRKASAFICFQFSSHICCPLDVIMRKREYRYSDFIFCEAYNDFMNLYYSLIPP